MRDGLDATGVTERAADEFGGHARDLDDGAALAIMDVQALLKASRVAELN